jgi:hypothetical protein
MRFYRFLLPIFRFIEERSGNRQIFRKDEFSKWNVNLLAESIVKASNGHKRASSKTPKVKKNEMPISIT